MTERAQKSIKNKAQKPPEIRVLRNSNDAKVFLVFTNNMNFPSNFTDILNIRAAKKVSNDTKSLKSARFLEQ